MAPLIGPYHRLPVISRNFLAADGHDGTHRGLNLSSRPARQSGPRRVIGWALAPGRLGRAIFSLDAVSHASIESLFSAQPLRNEEVGGSFFFLALPPLLAGPACGSVTGWSHTAARCWHALELCRSAGTAKFLAGGGDGRLLRGDLRNCGWRRTRAAARRWQRGVARISTFSTGLRVRTGKYL